MGIILHVQHNPWVHNMEAFYANSPHTLQKRDGTSIMVIILLNLFFYDEQTLRNIDISD